MTRSEFDRWWSNYAAVFPETAAWMNNLRDDDRRREAKEAIKTAWANALRDVDLCDAEEVTRLMIAGEVPAVSNFEREQTAAKVRHAARDVRTRRLARSLPRRAAEPDYRPRKDDMPLGKMLATAMDLREKGVSSEEIHRELLTMMPASDPLKGPRFHCAICEDTGHLSVWSRDVIRVLEAGEELPKLYREESIRCKCKFGHIVEKEPVYYDPARYCRVIKGDTTSDKALNDLTAWVDAKNAAKRTSVFDQYNDEPSPASF